MKRFNDLVQRHEIEQQFHDGKARDSAEDFYAYGALEKADACLWGLLGDLRGRRVLEIGCGDGFATPKPALAGAQVVSIDVSKGMVEVTREKVRRLGCVERVTLYHMGAEDIEFERGSFDLVYGHSVLHHLDLKVFGPKCSSILRDGGAGCFLEPLDHNPFLNLFRKITPHRRTPTEKPLTFDELRNMSLHFGQWGHREFYLISLFAFVWYYGIRSKAAFRFFQDRLMSLDELTFRLFPPLRRYAWISVVRFQK